MTRWRWVWRCTRAMLVVCGAALGLGCQEGYPIPATRCDEWCDQTRRIDCATYDPAACVVACEKAGVGRPACADLVDQTVACLRGKTDHETDCATWLYTGQTPCLNEQTATLQCGSQGGSANSPGTE